MNRFNCPLQTSRTLWAVFSVGLFLATAFINPMPDIKGSVSLWGGLYILLRGDYFCSTEEMIFATGCHARLLAIPALVFGWVLQGLIVAVPAALRVGQGRAPTAAPPG